MSYEVTAAFEERIPFPEDQSSDDFDYVFLVRGDDAITDPSIHFYTCLAKEALTRYVEKQVPEASSILRSLDTRISEKDLGINYDQFLDIVQSQGGKLVKNIGLGQQDDDNLIIKWPIYDANNLRSLSTTLMGSTYSGQINIKLDSEQVDYETIYGAHGALSLALARSTNFETNKIFNIDLTVDENLIDTILNGDGANFNFTDKLDKDAISAVKRLLGSVQIQVRTPTASQHYPYVPKEAEKGEPAVPETESMARTREIDRKKSVLNDMLYYSNVCIYVNIQAPTAIFKFFTQSDSIDLQDCHRWFSSYYTNGFVNDKYVPGIMRSLSSVIEDTKNLKKAPLSKDNYAVNFEGQVVYIPNVEDTSIYDQLKEAQDIFIREESGIRWYDPNFVLSLSEVVGSLDLQTTLKTTLQSQYNRVLYTDWALNKLIYTNTMGNINIMDLNGWKPASLSSLCTLFKSKLTSNEEHSPVASALTDLNKLLPAISPDKPNFLHYAELEDLVHFIPLDRRDHFMGLTLDQAFAYIYELRLSWGFPDTIQGECNFFEYFREVRVALSRINENPAKEQIYGEDFDYEIFAEEPTLRSLTDWPMLRCVHRAAKMVLTHIEQDPLMFIQKTGVVRSIGIIPIIKIISEDNPSDLIAQDKASREMYIRPNLDPNYTPLPVPNIGKHVSLLPHQVKVDNHVKNNCPYTVLNVAPGGGKTISGLITGLREMQKNKKVLVLCPNYLMKNYVSDGLYMAQGRLNTICIDNQVYTEYGEERLGRLINNAPPNTLFLSGFSVFSMGKNINYEYFGDTIVINQICEFIRSINWDLVIIDESHQLANSSSNRSRQIARLLAGVPRVMQMTGTYINNMVTDALGQSRLFDPSMLGSEDEFVRQYALATSNGKFAQPKPGAQSHIFQRLKSRSDFVSIRRKEWVALLPQRKEQFHIVSLTYNQQRAYESILKEVIKEIEDDAPDAVKQKLKQGSESDSEALEQYLKRYLARVERFLTACNLDPLGEKMLTDAEDLISPKCQMVNEILTNHFSDPDAQKVLIFTSYRDSARAIYEALDPEFQQYALHYEAERKDELIPRMKNDPNVKVIVGVEHSLNTGHNLQSCNRLIRVESVWNPGTLDQAESRINRPDPKNKETRGFIYFDWILCQSSIDMTKASRLISKLISATKFDEVGNPLYESIPDLPVVSMSFDNIIHSNSFDDSLSDYVEAYRQYQVAQIQDFKQYKELTGNLEPVPLPQGETIEGSALINPPYVPNMELPYQDEMGLINIGDWAMEQSLPVSRLDNSLLKGRRVHCQYGDGTIISASKTRIRINLDNGNKESIDKLSAFLIPDDFNKRYKNKTVKDIISKLVALPYTGQSEEILEELEEEHVEQEKKEKEKEEQSVEPEDHPTPFKGTNKLDGEIDVFLASANDMLCVIVDLEEPDFTANIAREFGMKNSGPYWFAHCKSYKHLDNLLDKVMDTLNVPQKQVDILDELLEAFTEGRSKLFNVDQTTRFEIKNFYDMKRRKVPKGTIYLYPIIEDGNFYVAAWEERQPSIKDLIKVRIPGVRWEYDPGNYRRFFTTKKEAQVFIKSLAKRFNIINFDQVKEEYRNIKLIKRKPRK